jgi:hypothetical protein
MVKIGSKAPKHFEGGVYYIYTAESLIFTRPRSKIFSEVAFGGAMHVRHIMRTFAP